MSPTFSLPHKAVSVRLMSSALAALFVLAGCGGGGGSPGGVVLPSILFFGSVEPTGTGAGVSRYLNTYIAEKTVIFMQLTLC